MPKDFYTRMAEQRLQEQEGFALANGYLVVTKDNTTNYALRIGNTAPIALCPMREDAVRIAYAMAMVFPIKDAKP